VLYDRADGVQRLASSHVRYLFWVVIFKVTNNNFRQKISKLKIFDKVSYNVQINFELRYFMSYPGSSIKGDNSEEFAFKTLFPGYTRPFGALLGNISFALCEMCGFCKVVDTPDVEMGVTNVKPSVSIPDVPQATSEAERQMAERRRQLAFKAINERLEQLKKQQASKKAAASTKEGTQKIAVADPKTKAAKD